ncbi:hypothetical protein ACFZAV_21885 [Streptomyces sp. NPDC008343]|uniref:hypothetical protein n=1 Tax=Streptomyces sp. NPDC008343 TaxID=3364828 RepID=UPI0036E44978
MARGNGTPLWFSRATPGRTQDLTVARAHCVVQACQTRQILVLAARAYQGASAWCAPPTTPQRTARAPSAGQLRPRQTAGTERTRLRSVEVLADCPQGTLLTRRISRTVQAVHTLLTCNYEG